MEMDEDEAAAAAMPDGGGGSGPGTTEPGAGGDVDTQLLDDGAAPPPDGSSNVDPGELLDAEAEAEEESSGSSAAEMSGGTNRSSGGYSGDYSSISDSSSDNRGESKKGRGGHRKGHAERALARGGGDGGDEQSALERADEAMQKADMGASRPSMDDGATMMQRQCAGGQIEHADVNAHAAGGRRHAAHHQPAMLPAEHIHSYHRHNHGHHKGKAKQQPTEEVERQIDEIMNLYNVSLEAAKQVGVEVAAQESQGRGSAAGIQVEASAKHHGLSAPQLGGLRITDPLDPRINIQKLYQSYQRAAATYRASEEAKSRVVTSSKFVEEPGEEANDGAEHQAAQGECYANIMEACRPFFNHGVASASAVAPSVHQPRALPATSGLAAAADSQSSSGFTSFFTTTKSESNRTNSGGSGGSFSAHDESVDTNQAVAVDQVPHGHSHHHQRAPTKKVVDRQHHANAAAASAAAHHPNCDQSDSSSMVVLARPKRKHKEQQSNRQQAATAGATSSSNSNSDNTTNNGKRSGGGDGAAKGPSSSKRVRIETVALDGAKRRSQASGEQPAASGDQQPTGSPASKQQCASSSRPLAQQQKRTESSSLTSSLTQSLDSSGSDSGQQQPNKEKKKEDAESGTGSNVEGGSSNTDSGGTTAQNQPSSSTADGASGQASSGKQPRVVTDITSSGTTTANGSTGSGTGSGNENNTTSKSESGGSGGGNFDGQKNGASGERDRDSTGGSDACGGGGGSSSAAANEDAKKPGEGGHQPAACAQARTDKPLIHHHHHGGHHDKVEGGGKPPPAAESNMDSEAAVNVHQEDANDAMVSKEKIMEKKRKRMNMRREYEEEVQRQMRDSSESSSIANDNALEPGKPVTLEEVLSFTKTARLLVQALPPFLAVHVNAAFTSLCGIQSSAAIGTPVASIISLPDASAAAKEGDSSGSGSDNTKQDAMSSLSGSVDGNSQNDSNMAIANDAAGQGGNDAQRDESGHIQNNGIGLRIDRLIVARGYGHIHEVNVVSLPHHSHSHVIEGSEVKFIEGNGPAKRRKKDDSKILCRMSVSPVISTFQADARHHGHADPNASPQQSSINSKRRKTRPTPNELNSVKHYLIQLEAVDGPRLLISRSSLSSSTDTTMEAQLLGITKTEVHARRCRLERRHGQSQVEAQREGNNQVDRPETEDSQDDTGSAMEPVATCG